MKDYYVFTESSYDLEKEENRSQRPAEIKIGEVDPHTSAGAGALSLSGPADLEAQFSRVNQELVRYTSQADKTDYAFAIASGLITGFIDSVFVGEMNITQGDIGLSHKQVNQFIEK